VKLTVHSARTEDFLQDVVRVHSSHRQGIRTGQLCQVSQNGKHIYAIARNTGNRTRISLDSAQRRTLDVRAGQEADFQFRHLTWFEELNWVWHATDPINRTAGRLGILSFWLGIIGLLLGALSLYLALRGP
jgi:hypothetical protein